MTQARGAGAPDVAVSRDGLPGWLTPVADAAEGVRPEQLSRFLPPAAGGRQSAVLVLFGEQPPAAEPVPAAEPAPGGDHADAGRNDRVAGAAGAPDLLLIERSAALRSHAGQPSFPGGALDPVDGDPEGAGPLRAALREAREETGLDPAGVQVFGVLPRLYIPVSGFVVTPVLGWWRDPSPVGVVDPAETARVFRVPIADLAAPANRAMLTHPSGFRGPAFLVAGALVWGFTAGVIDKLLHFAGWEVPWDRERTVPLG